MRRWKKPPNGTARPLRARGDRAGSITALRLPVKPPTVTLFVNDPKLFNDNYRRYIERQFRQQLGFQGTPVRLFWRGKKVRELEQSANRAIKVKG